MTSEIYIEISGQYLDVLPYNYENIYLDKICDIRAPQLKMEGTIKAAKVWYDDLSTYLVKLGFKANLRDECVFKMNYKGRQVSIDNLMILCEY